MRRWSVQITKDIEKDVRKERDLQGKRKDCVIYERIGKELLKIMKRNVKENQRKLHMKVVGNVIECSLSQT